MNNDEIINELNIIKYRINCYISEIMRQTDLLYKTKIRMKKSNIKWTNEAIINEARKYKSSTEWKMKSPSSYQMAMRNKILHECRSHMELRKKKWTKEAIINEARKYDTVSEWIKYSINSYQSSRLLGILNECKSHMKKYQQKEQDE